MSNRMRITTEIARGLIFVTFVVATPVYLFQNTLALAFGGAPWV